MTDILKAIGTAIVILGAIGFLFWYLGAFPKFYNCVMKGEKDSSDCTEEFISGSPPMQQAEALNQACNNGSDLECLSKLATMKVKKNLEDKST